MDGNRRWAKEKYLPTLFWHKAWFDNVQTITREAKYAWVSHLTLWALSTENFNKRESEEISWIIKLIHHVPKLLPKFQKESVKLQVIWDIWRLPSNTQDILQDIQDKTQSNDWIVLTVALVYGWQDEIVRATKKIIAAWVDPSTLSTEEFKKYLDTAIIPSPDLIIRTGWDIRHSWFLLYDSAYSEYYFTDKKWPEFDKNDLLEALSQLESSKRNFWK